MRRVILRLSVGWLPPSVPPSGAYLTRGSSLLDKPRNAAEGVHPTGAASLPMHVGEPVRVERCCELCTIVRRLGLTR
jgi:hypothetical protein